jgi:hypothetical protein
VRKLAYELEGASNQVQDEVMSSFVGLVTALGHYPAWVSGLQGGEYMQNLARWRTETNVVMADGLK